MKKQKNAAAQSFGHLTAGAESDTTDNQQDQNAADLMVSDDQPEAPKKHSRAHNVAVSEEAAESPALAVHLLRETDLSSKKIRARLRDEPEYLSKFTVKYMEENDPTWEFLDDEERVIKALQVSSQHGDINGYMTARQQAVQALKKMEEPMTEDEMQKMIERTRQAMNKANPDTPDNTEARQKADEEYQRDMAKAAEKLRATYKETGVTLRG
ncbi:hypothetical protein [Morganella morganii]|nr:hypothetical protein [Morganella morganii]MBT0412003.1 hypothetical protein [Morganella morganii subsp. morganii]WNP29095.1 hypothetical protein RN616_11165 [Morganella morganii]